MKVAIIGAVKCVNIGLIVWAFGEQMKGFSERIPEVMGSLILICRFIDLQTAAQDKSKGEQNVYHVVA